MFQACTCQKNKAPDLSKITIKLDIDRYEKRLMQLDTNHFDASLQQLQLYDSSFYKTYMQDILEAGDIKQDGYKIALRQFITNPYIRGLNDTIQKKYPDLNDLKPSLIKVLQYYKYYFPDEKTPKVYTMMSEFGYGAVKTENTVAIGLDMFLGENYVYYPAQDFPYFFIRKLKKDFILPTFAGVLGSDKISYPKQKTLLDNMIYKGKQMYLTKLLLPNANDTLITGFTSVQQQWCIDNESEIWKYFISENLLYNTNVNDYRKYISDSPNAPGMPSEAPGNVGSYIGMRIMEKYHANHANLSLEEILKQNDVQTILRQSKYKPK